MRGLLDVNQKTKWEKVNRRAETAAKVNLA